MSFAALLDRTFTIQRPTITRDASGGAARAFANVLLNLPCAISPARASVIADYARRDMVVDHHIYTTRDLDAAIAGGVRLGDRLTDGSAYYLVKAVKRTANSLVSGEVVYEIDCEKKA